MIPEAPRYDGHAEWYDQTFSVFHPPSEEPAFLRQALGTGHGQVCLDLACGTGLCAQPITDAGYRAVGFDMSADQLRFARRRLDAVVRADACLLPVQDESVAVVVGMFFHTDLEDFTAVARQVARCLRPRGRLIYAGLHPCFIGPFVDRTSESAERRLHFSAGYGSVGWANRASGDGSGLGGRLGFHHKTLASFLGAIASSGEYPRCARVLRRRRGAAAEHRSSRRQVTRDARAAIVTGVASSMAARGCGCYGSATARPALPLLMRHC